MASPHFPLPSDLPEPIDDGACNHLVGLTMPHVTLSSTVNLTVDVGALGRGRTIIYFYPMTGVPSVPLPHGWDLTPGARGCTPQACGFRDHHAELSQLGATVFGAGHRVPTGDDRPPSPAFRCPQRRRPPTLQRPLLAYV
jgi:hypothetical protein